VEVGIEGERVDKRDYVSKWEQTVRSAEKDDPVLQKVRSGIPLSAEEETALAARLNSPRLYFNEDNLRRAYRNPGGTLVDFVKAALGTAKVKSREEEVDENFRAWLVSKKLTTEQAQYLALLKNRGLVRGNVELDDLFRPPLSILNAATLGVELFGEAGLREIVADMNDSVFSEESAEAVS
jgi:type I restriction enzyme R subunit